MLRFAAQNVPRKMEGRSAARQVPDSLCSGESFWNRPHNGTDGSGVILTTSNFSFCGMSRTKRCFHIFNFQLWREIPHESVIFTSSTFTFWGKSHKLKLRCTHDKVAAMSFCWFFLFVAAVIFLVKFPFRKRTFLGFGAELRFWSRFWARKADKSWDQLRRADKSLENVRRGEKR